MGAAAIAAIPFVIAGAQVASGIGSMAAHQYQAKVASNNAGIARQNAVWAEQFGEIDATNASLKTRADIGGQRAKTAAGGIDTNSGSAAAVEAAQGSLGRLNALTIRSNASREAYGLNTKAAGYDAEGHMLKLKSYMDIPEALVGAGSSFLSTSQSVDQLNKTYGPSTSSPMPVIS